MISLHRFSWFLTTLGAIGGCALAPSVLEKTPWSALELTRPEPLLIEGPQAQWRAINRLTYGPTPEVLAQIQAAKDPLTWALDQLDAARAASRQAARLPPDLADLDKPLPALFASPFKQRW